MRLIDADEIIIPCMETTTDNYRVQSMIDEEPTVDAVPVIRCKDCRFWDWMPASTATPDYHLCRRPFQPIAMTEYDFCSHAERKEEHETD